MNQGSFSKHVGATACGSTVITTSWDFLTEFSSVKTNANWMSFYQKTDINLQQWWKLGLWITDMPDLRGNSQVQRTDEALSHSNRVRDLGKWQSVLNADPHMQTLPQAEGNNHERKQIFSIARDIFSHLRPNFQQPFGNTANLFQQQFLAFLFLRSAESACLHDKC